MNIIELLEAAKELEKSCNCKDGGKCTCEGKCKCHEEDLAAAPADMETMDIEEIKIVEPEIDTKELLKKLEDFDLTVNDAIKEQDPEQQFEMIDNKQPLEECDTQLLSDEEKEARAEELKKTRSKRNTKVEEDFKADMEDGSPKEIKIEEPELDCEKEVKKGIEEPKKVEVEDLLESKDEVIAQYESKDGKHEVIRTSEGLYKNRYFINEDGKARRVTRGVKTLPTAVGALMKRFPEATQIEK